MLHQILCEQSEPGCQGPAWRQRCIHTHARARALLAFKPHTGSDALCAPAHAADAKAEQPVILHKTSAIIFHLETD